MKNERGKKEESPTGYRAILFVSILFHSHLSMREAVLRREQNWGLP